MNTTRLILATAAAALALPIAAPVLAADEPTQNAQIVERGANGRAEVVRIDGKEYPVCTAQLRDGCINPRAAGLDWGDRPLSYWPGMPASEMPGNTEPETRMGG